MVRIYIGVILFFVAATTQAQSIKKLKRMKTASIQNASVDRLGNFFLEFSDGQIKKYDPDGKMMARLKTQNLPTLLEPWFHPKIFAYYQKDMRIVNYNRMFEVSDDFKLDASIAIEPTLVCPTNDNRFLVLDEADLSIKKFENNQNRVLNEFKIDTTHWNKHFQFSFMREYLHLIFLLDKNQGIIIVNELGKTMKHLPVKVENFGFFGEELFYLLGNKIIFFDLYSGNTRELTLAAGKFGIVTDERIFIVNEKEVVVYQFNPDKPDDKE